MMDHEARSETGPDRDQSNFTKALRRLELCVKRSHELSDRLRVVTEPIMAPEGPEKAVSVVTAVNVSKSPFVGRLEELCDGLDASSEQIERTINRFDV